MCTLKDNLRAHCKRGGMFLNWDVWSHQVRAGVCFASSAGELPAHFIVHPAGSFCICVLLVSTPPGHHQLWLLLNWRATSMLPPIAAELRHCKPAACRRAPVLMPCWLEVHRYHQTYGGHIDLRSLWPCGKCHCTALSAKLAWRYQSGRVAGGSPASMALAADM